MFAKSFIFVFNLIFSASVAHAAIASNKHKMQDADYAKIWCDRNCGDFQMRLSNGLRPDCTTRTHVVEVDRARAWRANIEQALNYGASGPKRGMLVLIIENEQDEVSYKEAQEDIRQRRLQIDLGKVKNFRSHKESLSLIDGPVVKLSRKAICHVKNTGSYADTVAIKEFDTLDACLKFGGRKDKRFSMKTLKAAEMAAIDAHYSPYHQKLSYRKKHVCKDVVEYKKEEPAYTQPEYAPVPEPEYAAEATYAEPEKDPNMHETPAYEPEASSPEAVYVEKITYSDAPAVKEVKKKEKPVYKAEAPKKEIKKTKPKAKKAEKPTSYSDDFSYGKPSKHKEPVFY